MTNDLQLASCSVPQREARRAWAAHTCTPRHTRRTCRRRWQQTVGNRFKAQNCTMDERVQQKFCFFVGTAVHQYPPHHTHTHRHFVLGDAPAPDLARAVSPATSSTTDGPAHVRVESQSGDTSVHIHPCVSRLLRCATTVPPRTANTEAEGCNESGAACYTQHGLGVSAYAEAASLCMQYRAGVDAWRAGVHGNAAAGERQAGRSRRACSGTCSRSAPPPPQLRIGRVFCIHLTPRVVSAFACMYRPMYAALAFRPMYAALAWLRVAQRTHTFYRFQWSRPRRRRAAREWCGCSRSKPPSAALSTCQTRRHSNRAQPTTADRQRGSPVLGVPDIHQLGAVLSRASRGERLDDLVMAVPSRHVEGGVSIPAHGVLGRG
jgi:hypothetical protein